MRKCLYALASLALLSGVAHAAEATPPPENLCEVACTYKAGSGPRLIVSCVERTDAKQCAAIADHKNLNDAYPARMSCAAKLVQTCKEERRF
ncbi:MAG: hypothetical protein WA943_12380 [Parvibaculum sp.]|uniref:hypothetical protein n=1 Tax=Parvibaculum sp. TaxID=2024848 RepID=UPI003C74433E